MPSAGAVAPPIIVPLRKPVPGVPSTHIDTTTYIDLESGSHNYSLPYYVTINPYPNLFKIVSRYRDPQILVHENYSYLFNLRFILC